MPWRPIKKNFRAKYGRHRGGPGDGVKMASRYEQTKEELRRDPRMWLITGVAGFIGSNLLEALLTLGQRVVGLDNLAAGKKENLEQVKSIVGDGPWKRFQLVEGDIVDTSACAKVCRGV